MKGFVPGRYGVVLAVLISAVVLLLSACRPFDSKQRQKPEVTSAFVNREGIVTHVQVGSRTGEEIDAFVAEIVQE